MPAISLDTLNRILPIDKQQQIIDSVFGKQQPAANPEPSALERARNAWDMSYQEMLNSQKARIEKQRTDDVKMAKYNALGNLLTSMVQPLGWAAGGSTAGVIPYDNRQYLDSFNRALKADEDLRNIGVLEDEYKLKLAEEDYRRELARADEERNRENAWADYQKKKDYDAKIQSDLYKQRYEEEMNKIYARAEGKLDIEKFKAQFKLRNGNGTKISKDIQAIFYERAATAWANYVSDYLKKDAANVNLKPMMSQEEFLKNFALQSGYRMETNTPVPKKDAKPEAPVNPQPETVTQPGAFDFSRFWDPSFKIPFLPDNEGSQKKTEKTEKKGGFQTGSTPTGGKKGGFQK